MAISGISAQAIAAVDNYSGAGSAVPTANTASLAAQVEASAQIGVSVVKMALVQEQTVAGAIIDLLG